MFPEPVTFPSSAELIQDLFLARLTPKLRGMYNRWTGQGPISQKDLSPDLGLNLRLWS